MKLTIFNCSPKLAGNNTDIMLKKFIEGFETQKGNQVQVQEYKLNKLESTERAVEIFDQAEVLLIAFPLYCYAMPGGVKLFIEALEPLCGKWKDKKLAFLVQYGFREAIHARPLEKYLIKLTSLLGCEYLGTIIKGGCDGLASGKGMGAEGVLKGIYNIGLNFGRTGRFNQDELNAYSAPEFEKKNVKFIMKLIMKMINKFYWGAMLKKNGVTIEESFAKPYEI